MRILLVEDEQILRVSLARELAQAGHVVVACERPAAALAALSGDDCDVVVADVRLPGMDGFAMMDEARRDRPDLPFVFMTAYGTVRDAVQAMRLGAVDYVTKPFEVEELLGLLDRIRRALPVREGTATLRRRLESLAHESELGVSAAMQQVREALPSIADSDEIVLITGETGTGKEHLAQLIHARSRRAGGPFVPVSCAALNPEVIESELFGHEKGAFPGAEARRLGRFERAQGGTLLLDEIDDVPLALQVKLLRALQSNTVERVGGDRAIRVDVRVIAAAKVDLATLVQAGTFRQDLYYRLHVLPLQLPPLRERLEDLPMLVEHLLRRHAPERRDGLAPGALQALASYAWPGNVRELENLVKRLVLQAPEGPIEAAALPATLRQAPARESAPPRTSYSETVARVEREILLEALQRAGGNRTRAAESLGLPASTFRDKLAKLGIGE